MLLRTFHSHLQACNHRIGARPKYGGLAALELLRVLGGAIQILDFIPHCRMQIALAIQ